MCTLYVTARGLTTSPIPHGTRTFEISLRLLDHNLSIQTSDGMSKSLGLFPRSVAEFYHEVMGALHALDLDVTINPIPQEVSHAIRCDEDDIHASYDAVYAHRCLAHPRASGSPLQGLPWALHRQMQPRPLLLGQFRSGRYPLLGATRPGAARRGSHYSRGIFPRGDQLRLLAGGGAVQEAAFYAYAVPEPAGLRDVDPPRAWRGTTPELGEFLLRYEDVRTAADPDALVLDFLQSTYEAAATLGGWDRATLERSPRHVCSRSSCHHVPVELTTRTICA